MVSRNFAAVVAAGFLAYFPSLLAPSIRANENARAQSAAFAGTTDSGRTPPTRAGDGVFRGARAVDPRSAGGANGRQGHLARPGRVVPCAHPGLRSGRAASQRDRADQPARARRRRGAGSRARGKRAARSAARHPGVDQGQLRHRRYAHVRWRARVCHAAAGGRRVSSAQAARSRRGHSRQDDDARARVRDHQHLVADQPDAQPLRSVSNAGRIERRYRRRDRRELRRRGHGQRHMRIDSHSRRQPEPRRLARHARAVEPQRRDAAIVHAGHRRPAARAA